MRLLSKYFLFTYLLSWTCFIGVAQLSHGTSAITPGSVLLQQILVFAGVISPSIIAIWLTARASIPGQPQKLFNKIGKWKVDIKWDLFAFGFMVLIKLGVALTYKLITGLWPEFGQTPWYSMVVAVIFTSWVQAGEEIGWRGFALPL